jgi:gamma-glutamylcyclotransferase (GGCT)/AIG2-like uncharacterized protein YtfP
MPFPLFIYGTLHPDKAPAAIATTARLLKPLGRGTIRGRMYNLGEYPGVILASDPHAGEDEAGVVPGALFSIPDIPGGPDASAILARLDAYEDFRPEDPEGSLFLRQIATATVIAGAAGSIPEGAEIDCWVYTYNRSLPDCSATM